MFILSDFTVNTTLASRCYSQTIDILKEELTNFNE